MVRPDVSLASKFGPSSIQEMLDYNELAVVSSGVVGLASVDRCLTPFAIPGEHLIAAEHVFALVGCNLEPWHRYAAGR